MRGQLTEPPDSSSQGTVATWCPLPARYFPTAQSTRAIKLNQIDAYRRATLLSHTRTFKLNLNVSYSLTVPAAVAAARLGPPLRSVPVHLGRY